MPVITPIDIVNSAFSPYPFLKETSIPAMENAARPMASKKIFAFSMVSSSFSNFFELR